MMAAMDTARCNMYRLSREHALVLVVLTIFGRLACGAGSELLCYSCTNVPHPRDCNRIVRCGSSESCSVESFLTPSGTRYYDMGCSGQLKCQNALSSIVGRRESISMLPTVKKRGNTRLCIECCRNNSFCNRELCDTKVNLTGKLCMQCDDVVSPQDCATVALCQDGEICYTESITIHGENRYRLGCVKETSCQPLAASETITTPSSLWTTCGICCKRDIENCNLELCDQRGSIPPRDVVQMYLVDPPIDITDCRDHSETACVYSSFITNNFCDSPFVKNQLCPKFCRTCTPSPTLAPAKFTTDGTDTTDSMAENSTSDTTHQTQIITESSTMTPPSHSTSATSKECFFRSVVYLGDVSKTIDNITCDRWDAHLLLNDPLVSMLPDQSLKDAANYCRDPDNKGHPWCYIKGHPSKSWEFCDVPYCHECYYANQSHVYNGYISTTNNGECLDWAGRLPFADSSFSDGNITKSKNYCRDPDNTGYPYCITTRGLSSCMIPQCKGTCDNDPSTGCDSLKHIICQREHVARLFCPKTCNMCGFGLLEPVHRPPPVHQANSTYDVTSTISTTRSISTLPPSTTISSPLPTKTQDCFFKSSLYVGHVNRTIDNVTCDRWDAHISHSDPLTLKLPDVSTSDAANYCRDPDEKGHPWCYVSTDPQHKTWEFCDVLFCRECYFANRSHEYNGYVTSSMKGNCLAWTGTTFPDSSFPDGSVARAKHYCRDPDNRGYPYCPTSHGFLPCLIPKCNHSVCADDPSTLCEILKSVICGVKDMAQKLCPKTCGMCGFSLMSPVHIKPPVHNAHHPACEDNPMARCDTLKEFICGTTQGAQLCPKTCNLCSANNNTVNRTMSNTRSITTPHPASAIRSRLSTVKQDICVDSANFSCNDPNIKSLVCIDPPAASNFCRKTCGYCDKDVVKFNNSCGDPIETEACQRLQDDLCLCYDEVIYPVLCPHYCAGQCGPVNRTVTCPLIPVETSIGRR